MFEFRDSGCTASAFKVFGCFWLRGFWVQGCGVSGFLGSSFLGSAFLRSGFLGLGFMGSGLKLSGFSVSAFRVLGFRNLGFMGSGVLCFSSFSLFLSPAPPEAQELRIPNFPLNDAGAIRSRIGGVESIGGIGFFKVLIRHLLWFGI